VLIRSTDCYDRYPFHTTRRVAGPEAHNDMERAAGCGWVGAVLGPQQGAKWCEVASNVQKELRGPWRGSMPEKPVKIGRYALADWAS